MRKGERKIIDDVKIYNIVKPPYTHPPLLLLGFTSIVFLHLSENYDDVNFWTHDGYVRSFSTLAYPEKIGYFK